LIVVIAILGILAALAVPRLVGTQQTARYRAHNANVATLKSAANIAVAEHGAPGGDGIEWDGATQNEDDDPYLWEDYLDGWPENPLSDDHENGGPYTVEINGDGEVTVEPGPVDEDGEPVTP
jgi:type IV pilus assembly protein PilA